MAAPEIDVAGRVATIDWPRIGEDLNRSGHAAVPRLLTPQACASVASLYEDEAAFRSRVVMARHGYGSGE
jgi:hypothetical protein